nr:hypothetical protein Iba_chr10dCG10360 [Ipomoea batatas]
MRDKRKGSSDSSKRLSNCACGWSTDSNPFTGAGRAADARPASSSTPKQNWAEPESLLLDAPLDARPAWRLGIPRPEMMVPRHTLERGETSRGNHDDSPSEEGEGYNMEYANRGLMLQVEDLFRSWLGRRTRNDNITRSELFILWSMYTETPVHMGELCKRILKRQSYEDSENIFIGPFVSRLAEALGFGEALCQEVVTTTMRPIDMEECVHLGLRFNDTMEETRERERELWDTIRRLENRVDVLELEVRRLILDSHGEEPFELREWSSAPR